MTFSALFRYFCRKNLEFQADPWPGPRSGGSRLAPLSAPQEALFGPFRPGYGFFGQHFGRSAPYMTTFCLFRLGYGVFWALLPVRPRHREMNVITAPDTAFFVLLFQLSRIYGASFLRLRTFFFCRVLHVFEILRVFSLFAEFAFLPDSCFLLSFGTFLTFRAFRNPVRISSLFQKMTILTIDFQLFSASRRPKSHPFFVIFTEKRDFALYAGVHAAGMRSK